MPLTKIADFLRADVEVRVLNNTLINVLELTPKWAGQDFARWWELTAKFYNTALDA